MVFNNNLLLGAAGAAGGYTIDQSIRFNDDDSAYLYRTPSSAGNRKTWTWSCWFKRGNINLNGVRLFDAYGSASDSGYTEMEFSTGNTINFGGWNTTWFVTSQVFRDVSAWYHMVLAVDTTQATAGDRIKFYINGEQVTAFSTQNFPSLNADLAINDTVDTRICQVRSGAGSKFFDGYLAEVYLIDGTALDASSFGEVNADTGQWVPIKYTGSYGTNGFYITGENSAALGTDYSGNGNNFTSSGLTSADQVTDTPTDNYSTWNSVSGTWLYPATFSDGNLTALRSSGGTNIVRSTISFPATGNWYAEFTIDATGSGSHVWQVGVLKDDDPEAYDTVEPRASDAAGGYVYITNWSGSPVPSKANNGSAVSYGTGGTATDIIGVHLNNGSLTFYHNNSSQGVAYTGLSGDFVFAWSGQGGAQVTANFGQAGFTYTPPSSAVAVTTSNLSDPTIADPTAQFGIVTYSAGATSLTFPGKGFAPDLLWFKSRNTVNSHALFDVIRDFDKLVKSESTSAEETYYVGISEGIDSIDSNGFTLYPTDNGGYVNYTGRTYVSWGWKANGAGVSNTDGSITSTVSANTTAGFSIVSYVSNDTAGATVGHGLGVAPSVVIQKNRDSTDNWYVLHTSLSGAGYNLYLDLSNGEDSNTAWWNGTNPTSTVVTLGPGNGAGSGPNEPTGENRIMYCFAEVEGFSKFGSYTGNGSADGPFIFTGMTPELVIIKRSNTTENWIMLDNVRSEYNVTNDVLYPNLNQAENVNSATTRVDNVSNGFKVRGTNTNINASGSTYIFMAFARSPFKTANAR
jgi:hypothetical protein